jgi:hypothetical protein
MELISDTPEIFGLSNYKYKHVAGLRRAPVIVSSRNNAMKFRHPVYYSFDGGEPGCQYRDPPSRMMCAPVRCDAHGELRKRARPATSDGAP